MYSGRYLTVVVLYDLIALSKKKIAPTKINFLVTIITITATISYLVYPFLEQDSYVLLFGGLSSIC
jgi:hypothetical protein